MMYPFDRKNAPCFKKRVQNGSSNTSRFLLRMQGESGVYY